MNTPLTMYCMATVTVDKFEIIETVPLKRNTDVVTTDSVKGECSI